MSVCEVRKYGARNFGDVVWRCTKCGVVWSSAESTPPDACAIARGAATEPYDGVCVREYPPMLGEDPTADIDGYATLREALDAAYDQSANGKGKERHANDRAFTDQPILRITELVGHGFPLGQAIKKAQEASGMVKRGEVEAARAELLGAIVYLAAAWVHLGKD